MKKIRFDSDLTNSLKDLLEKIGTKITDENLEKVTGSGCGAVCKVTCSWWCREWLNDKITMEPPED